MKKTILYVVRHGQSEGNVNPMLSESDPALTLMGIDQVKKRARDLENVRFQKSFSSHLKRAVQTSQILTAELQIDHSIFPQLREREYGRFFENPSFDRILDEIASDSNSLGLSDWWQYVHPEATEIESYKYCFNRFYTKLNEIVVDHSGQTLLLVSHGDLMRSLLIHLGFGDHREISWEAVTNTGYVVLEYTERNLPKILKTVDIVKKNT